MLRHWIACIILLTNPPGSNTMKANATRENPSYQSPFISNLNFNSTSIQSLFRQTKSLLWNQKGDEKDEEQHERFLEFFSSAFTRWEFCLAFHVIAWRNSTRAKVSSFAKPFSSLIHSSFYSFSIHMGSFITVASEREGVDFIGLLNGDLFKCSAPSSPSASWIRSPNHIIMIFSFAFCLYELSFLCFVRSSGALSLWKDFVNVFWTSHPSRSFSCFTTLLCT